MIYVTGDIHGWFDINKLYSKSFPQQKTMTKNDYIIILGDFGLVWNNNPKEYKWRKWLDKKKFTTLFIDGNHDNHNLIRSFPEVKMFGNVVNQISESVFYLKRSQIYTIDNHTFLTLGGADSIDKHLRTENIDWWATEAITQNEVDIAIQNVANVGGYVDAVLTHDAPYMSLPIFYEPSSSSLMLGDLAHQIKFGRWYCGHYHSNNLREDKEHNQYQFLYEKILKIY